MTIQSIDVLQQVETQIAGVAVEESAPAGKPTEGRWAPVGVQEERHNKAHDHPKLLYLRCNNYLRKLDISAFVSQLSRL